MGVTRRGLLLAGAAAGGGLALWYGSRALDDGDAAARFAATTPGAAPLNAWLKIAPDGTVTCAVHRAEMGQGIATVLAMLLAEELDADWDRVRTEFAPVDRDYFNFGILERGRPLGDIEERPLAAAGTAALRRVFHGIGMAMTISSASAVDAWDTLRPAGAAARAMLIAAAARRWGTAPAALGTEPGLVVDPTGGRRAGFGELAAAAARERPPASPPLKHPDRFRLVGHPVPRVDVPDKARGTARFAIDQRPPGLRFAAVRHGPVAGGRIDRFAAQAALALDGVETVTRVGANALAVIARNSWTALRGAAALEIEADAGPADADTTTLYARYRAMLDAPEASVFRDDGDAPAALAGAAPLEAVYAVPYLAHLCLEPMNATALVADGRVRVWAPTQAHSIARGVAARVAGVPPAAVEVERTLMGGGFGRRAEMDFVEYAVAAAQAVPGTPVQVCFAREEDLRHDMYRPAALARLRAVLGDDGRIVALDARLVTQSVVASYYQRTPTPRGGDAAGDGSMASGLANLVYAVPHLRVTCMPADPGVPVGFWRSTGSSYNAFFVESFIDELAAAAGADPVEFRLRQLDGRPRHRRLLERAAALAGWGTPGPPGFGRGVALTESHGSICAQVVDVSAIPGGRPRVERIVCVLDCGRVLHPDVVRAQLEGALVDGLGAALDGEVAIRAGRVVPGNFDAYRLPRLADVPALQIELVGGAGRPGGVGEPGVPGVAPALANALAAATGERRRRLPLAEPRAV